MVDFFGLITYAVNIPISMANDKVLTELHELLINPLNNAVQYHQAK
jgi:two-component system cell cycle response regulator